MISDLPAMLDDALSRGFRVMVLTFAAAGCHGKGAGSFCRPATRWRGISCCGFRLRSGAGSRLNAIMLRASES